MEIRPAVAADVERLADIDATIHSLDYLHIDRHGEGLAMGWKVEQRPLRHKLVQAHPLSDDIRFVFKQVASSAQEGLALVAEHEGYLVGASLAELDPSKRVLKLLDIRVDFDYRRQGLGTAMLFAAVQEARRQELRAMMAQARTNNGPMSQFLLKGGFDLSGLDLLHNSNHDLVKESVELFWYAALD